MVVCVIPYAREPERKLARFLKPLALSILARGRLTMCLSARRLGAGGALTVLQFGPFSEPFGAGFIRAFWSVFHVHVRIVEPVPAKLEGGKWRRPNFFIVWPIEVS